jgi:hypothetical protein
MGIEMAIGQANWGTTVDNEALNGCGFVTGYSVYVHGSYNSMDAECDNEVGAWVADVHHFKPQAIIVEMGWWDSHQRLINGNVSDLAQPQYDSLVEQRIVALVASFRSVSAAPIYFLSVPWMQPPALPNGQTDPAASPAYHDEINSLIREATHSSSSVHFVDVSPYITPSGDFQASLDGGTCRASDGVHLYYTPLKPSSGVLDYVQTQCGKALQQGILSMIREDLAKQN